MTPENVDAVIAWGVLVFVALVLIWGWMRNHRGAAQMIDRLLLDLEIDRACDEFLRARGYGLLQPIVEVLDSESPELYQSFPLEARLIS